MGQMEDMRLFVQVVEAGGISKAAERLGIAKSAVSRRLGLLEARYDAKLIDREPGRWDVTETGRELLQRATRLVHEMDEIEGDFVNTSAVIEGPLTVSVPREFGIAFLNPALIDFKARYPQIRLTVDLDDRKVDLNRENYDLAIRIASAPDNGHDALRIGSVRHFLFASQEYLANRPPIEAVRDLQAHQCLNFGPARRAYWEFLSPSGKPERFEFPPHLNSNSGLFLLSAVRAGLGIARLPDFIVAGTEASVGIRQVLADIAIPEWGIYLVHAEDRRLNRRMRLFADEMKRICPSHQRVSN